MMGTTAQKVLAVAMAVGVLALHAGMALGAEVGRVQTASGRVVAVTEGSKTIVVESSLGEKPWIIGAEVTDQTRFGGRARGLQDVKTGDTVTIRWIREENRLAVQSVTLR